MKKIFILFVLMLTTIFTLNNTTYAQEDSSITYDDTWELHYEQDTMRLPGDHNSYQVFKIGWYVFNFDISHIYTNTNSWWTHIDIEDDMYIPKIENGFDPMLLYIEEHGQLAALSLTYYTNAITAAKERPGNLPVCFYSAIYPSDNEPPLFQTDSVDTYMSQRESINDIKNRIYAYDKKDKDVSHNIAIVKESYSHDKTEGIKEVDLQVNDTAGNISYHTVKINVIDDNVSTIASNDIFTTKTNIISEEFILENIEAKDYLGNPFDLEIIDDDYYENCTQSGIYNVTVNGIDQFGDTLEHTIQITVYNTEYEFYTLDKKTLHFDEYTDFTDEELLELLNIVTYFEEDYIIGVVDSRITHESGEHYIFYELYDGDQITEARLTICFQNSSIVTQPGQETTFNLSNYVTTFISSTILILLIIHIINHAVEKRK